MIAITGPSAIAVVELARHVLICSPSLPLPAQISSSSSPLDTALTH